MKLTAFAFEIRDGVAHITLDQAERGNPFDRQFAAEFNQLATECSINPDVRSVLIDANGRFFSVGGDLNALAKDRGELAHFVSAATADLHMAISRFARMNAPVVVTVHALAAGGAVALLAGADFVLATPAAKFYAAFAGIGIISDSGGSYFLPRRMGSRRATQFLMLNETLTAQEAAETGLVNRIVAPETLAEEGRALAVRLAQGPTLAFGELKNLLIAGETETLEAQLENEARAMARVTRTEDAWNAMRAVLAKQKPTFAGR
ncbi:2-(1,2-epoxy-1,2-dihydrophenyl)acetyl-CoA isomerase [Nitrobacteraceae bacterium AZCC 2146]